jgi:hypothetical protein
MIGCFQPSLFSQKHVVVVVVVVHCDSKVLISTRAAVPVTCSFIKGAKTDWWGMTDARSALVRNECDDVCFEMLVIPLTGLRSLRIRSKHRNGVWHRRVGSLLRVSRFPALMIWLIEPNIYVWSLYYLLISKFVLPYGSGVPNITNIIKYLADPFIQNHPCIMAIVSRLGVRGILLNYAHRQVVTLGNKSRPLSCKFNALTSSPNCPPPHCHPKIWSFI